MSLKESLIDFINQQLPPELFLVEAIVLDRRKALVSILIDGDQGVTVDQCAELSRKVDDWLEEQGQIEDAYLLEVGSPGADMPLKLPRQYPKHIGRSLEIEPIEEEAKKIIGKLTEVLETGIVLELPKPKKKVKDAPIDGTITIPFERIKKALVVINFNA
jgi:ribosome maturation factor RimP